MSSFDPNLLMYITGTVTSALDLVEVWRNKEGQFHRTDGPAYVERHQETGIVTHEQWRKDGRLHRAGGPAVTWRHPANGAVIAQEWWENGKNIPDPSAALKETGPVPAS